MGTRRKLLALIGGLLGAAKLARPQTTVKLTQVLGPAGAGGVNVLAPDGSLKIAQIGPGLSLINSNGSYTLQTVAMTPHRDGVKPARQAEGTYLCPDAAALATLKVYRNGLRQSIGEDFTFDPATKLLTPAFKFPWNPDDLILCDYDY